MLFMFKKLPSLEIVGNVAIVYKMSLLNSSLVSLKKVQAKRQPIHSWVTQQ